MTISPAEDSGGELPLLITSNTQHTILKDNDDDDLFIRPIKKHKIIFISDMQVCVSGVGVQSRFLIEGLIKTGRYTFRCLGGAIKHEKYDTVAINPDFIIKPVDGFGSKELLRSLLVTERPDAIVIFTDPRQFVWLWEMEDEIHQVCPIAYWHVWDNDPYPAFNNPWYEATDLINCLAQKTYDLIKPNFPDKTHYIPHTFPKNVYFPIPPEDLDRTKAENFGEDKKDWFKVLWVNRNAHRKMPGDLLVCWKKFLEKLQAKHGHNNALLIMHTDPKDKEGPNLFAITELLGLQDTVWFSTEKLQFDKMNLLQNSVDATINISKAEGYGLQGLIALQCGKPVVALCTGGETSKAIDPRDGSENGVALKPVKRSLVGSQLVPYIYEDFAADEDVANGLLRLFEMTFEEKEKMKNKVIDYADYAFNYDNMIKDWDKTLDGCIGDFKEKKKAGRGNWTLTPINLKAIEEGEQHK
jgi:glycosyltransferase involved in cell wall biosynthesis